MNPITDEDFAKLEQVGRISLTAELRQRIQRALERYEQHRRSRPKTHELAAKVAASLGESIRLINEMQGEYVRTWDNLAGQAEFSAADLKKLETLQTKCRQYGGRTLGRPHDIFLPSLLSELAKVYRQAGGETRIKHGTKEKRHGEFLDFLSSAQTHLPKDLRHGSKSALGAAWQEISSAFEKGKLAEIRMGIPGRFDLLITRRRNPKLRTDPGR
jgi:hypothetical protein